MKVEPIEAEATKARSDEGTEGNPPGPQWEDDQERKRTAYIASRANRFMSAALRMAFDSLGLMLKESDDLLRKRNPSDAPTLTRDIIGTAQSALHILGVEAAIELSDDGTFRIAYGERSTNLAPPPAAPTTPAPETPTT